MCETLATIPLQTNWYVGWGTLALINGGIAQGKHRSGLNWFVLSLLLGPIGTLILLTLDDPTERDRMTNEPDFVSVQDTGSPFEAEWIAGALRSEGIDAHVTDDLGGGTDPFQMARLATGAGIHILVPADSAEAARVILEKLEPPKEA